MRRKEKASSLMACVLKQINRTAKRTANLQFEWERDNLQFDLRLRRLLSSSFRSVVVVEKDSKVRMIVVISSSVAVLLYLFLSFGWWVWGSSSDVGWWISSKVEFLTVSKATFRRACRVSVP